MNNNSKSLKNTYAIQAKNVSVNYKDNVVINHLNIEVANGEFFTIVGKSGSGKTTLLKALAGLLKYSGKIDRDNKSLRLVFQDSLLLPWLTIEKNIALGAAKKYNSNQSELNKKQIYTKDMHLKRARNLLSELGMNHLNNRYPYNISGGEAQRVAIARAFASWPQIVLMDEPFGSLDLFTREQMQTWLLDFWKQHEAAIVFVTHDIEEALILGDRLAVLSNGKLASAPHNIPFPRPRHTEMRYTPEFLELRKQIRKTLAN